MKKGILFSLGLCLAFLSLPVMIQANSYTVGWNATTTTGTVLIMPQNVNGIRPVIFAPFFTATSTTVASTFPYASTTMISATTASSSNYYGGQLFSCNGASNALTWNAGTFGCNSIAGGSGTYPFTPSTNYSATAQATTGIVWFKNGLQASSTSQIAYASTTALTVSGNAYVAGNVGIGTMGPASTLDVLGSTNYAAQIKGSAGGGMIFGSYSSIYGGMWSANVTPSATNYSFITTGAHVAFNATSDLQFDINDVTKLWLSSVGGLSLGYGATDAAAGSMIISGNVGIGTTTPSQALDVKGNINIESGNGILLQDTVLGTCSIIKLTSGVLVATSHACI